MLKGFRFIEIIYKDVWQPLSFNYTFFVNLEPFKNLILKMYWAFHAQIHTEYLL